MARRQCRLGVHWQADDREQDQPGLAHARALLAIVRTAVQQMEGDKGLPAAVPAPAKSKTVANPFE